MKVEKFLLSIKEITENSEICLAHVSWDGQRKETLKEHTERTQKYWTKIIKEKQIDVVLNAYEKEMLKNVSEETRLLFEIMTWNIVTMHDMGKINPKFQEAKMKNQCDIKIYPNQNIGSKHSIISSVFYLDYFIKKIKEKTDVIEKEEQQLLREYAYIYSYIISRHHGELSELKKYIDGLGNRQAEGENLGSKAKEWLKEWKKETENQEATKYKANWSSLKKQMQAENNKSAIYLYTLTRLLYSTLVTADYYATAEFMDGTKIKKFGEIPDYQKIITTYENGKIQKGIRKQEKENYPINPQKWKDIEEINLLRTELFLDAERKIKENPTRQIFYLEAPTGSGKSNTAMNLSFQLLKSNPNINKIFYIYPFNTLVEQNMACMEKVFGYNEEIMSQIAVVNSIVPLKENKTNEEEYGINYQQILLDRQFLNYPMILSTHVMLFDTMFGNTKENAFAFHQLCNSVIVLDEIQSYKNDLWSEIIIFLKGIAELMNMKIIIMSATLPNLELLTGSTLDSVKLISDRDKYFKHKKFAGRVQISYELLKEQITFESLAEHIEDNQKDNAKILIEFLTKKSAEKFYQFLKNQTKTQVLLMTGDSSIQERKNIIKQVEEQNDIILIATQVVEAGVDIDMDIGYKAISKLDSEEQFMGRINRSGRKNGKVYFFQMDSGEHIYKSDIRIKKEKTLLQEKIREILIEKNFQEFYEKEILPELKELKERQNDENIEDFFINTVGCLNVPEISRRMKLINDNRQLISVYIARELEVEEGVVLDGKKLWQTYKELLMEKDMPYAEKTVKLYNLRSQMNQFIYQMSRDIIFFEYDRIGDISYIEDGESYFDEKGILMRNLLDTSDDLFI